jgi:hypothetical protein
MLPRIVPTAERTVTRGGDEKQSLTKKTRLENKKQSLTKEARLENGAR